MVGVTLMQRDPDGSEGLLPDVVIAYAQAQILTSRSLVIYIYIIIIIIIGTTLGLCRRFQRSLRMKRLRQYAGVFAAAATRPEPGQLQRVSSH
jgi:hypothetical protein